MPVSVLEAVSGPGIGLPPTGATASVTTATSPVTDDCVFVILNTQFERVITGVSGLGGVWDSFYSYFDPSTSYGSQSIWVCRNPVSAGTITVTAANDDGVQTAAAQLTALHVRGLPNPQSVPVATTSGSSITASSSLQATANELVLGALYVRTGPISSFTGSPAGWVVQPAVQANAAAYLQTAYLIPTGSATASFTFAGTGSFRSASIVRVISGSVPAPGTGHVVERHSGAFTTTANVTGGVDLPFTNVPQPGDLVFAVVGISSVAGGQTVNVSGLGAVWKPVRNVILSGLFGYWLYVGVGAYEAGNVQVTVLATAPRPVRAFAMLVTGLTGETITFEQHSAWNLTDLKAAGLGFDFSAPAAPDTLVLGVNMASLANRAFPNASSYSGFEVDSGLIGSTANLMAVAWHVADGATPNPLQLGVTTTAGSNVYIPLSEYWIGGPAGTRAVGTDTEMATSVASSVRETAVNADVMWLTGSAGAVGTTADYVEALTVTKVALVENQYYAEAVTELPSTFRSTSLYADAVTKAPSDLRAAGLYLEVLHRAPPVVKPSIGYWGILQAGP